MSSISWRLVRDGEVDAELEAVLGLELGDLPYGPSDRLPRALDTAHTIMGLRSVDGDAQARPRDLVQCLDGCFVSMPLVVSCIT